MIKLGSQLNRRKGKSARSRRISAILAMAMLFVTTSAIFVDSNNVSIIPGLDNASKVYAQTLSDEGKDYEDANKTAEANKNTADQLVEDIKEVNDEIAEQAKLIESSNQAIAQLDKEIELSEKDIAEVEDKISEKRQALGAVLSTIYESTEAQDDFSVLLRAKDMYDLLGRDEYVTDITNYIEDKIDDLELAEEEKYEKTMIFFVSGTTVRPSLKNTRPSRLNLENTSASLALSWKRRRKRRKVPRRLLRNFESRFRSWRRPRTRCFQTEPTMVKVVAWYMTAMEPTITMLMHIIILMRN